VPFGNRQNKQHFSGYTRSGGREHWMSR
jgi:hypothetical protein